MKALLSFAAVLATLPSVSATLSRPGSLRRRLDLGAGNSTTFEAEMIKGTIDSAVLGATTAMIGSMKNNITGDDLGSIYATCTVVSVVQGQPEESRFLCSHYLSFVDTVGSTGFGQVTAVGSSTLRDGSQGSLVVTGTSGDFSDSRGGTVRLSLVSADSPLVIEGQLQLS